MTKEICLSPTDIFTSLSSSVQMRSISVSDEPGTTKVQFSSFAPSILSQRLARRYPSTATSVSVSPSISNSTPVYMGRTSLSDTAKMVWFIMLFNIFCGREMLFIPSTTGISG